MKNIFKFTFLLSLTVLLNYSCTDESKFTNPVTHHLENGAFVRFVESPPTSVQPEDAQTLSINADVYDPAGNVAMYELSVTADIVSTGEVFHAENFITITSFPNTVSFTSQSIADAIGVDLSAFGAGDFFQFNAVATRTDGVKFYGMPPSFDEDNGTIGLGNTDSNLLNTPAYESAMRFDYIVACPMPETYFAGDYSIEILSSNAPFSPIFGTIDEVTFDVKNVYQRTMDVTYLADLAVGNGDIPFEITFLCGEAYATDGQQSGLACGGTIFLSNGGTTPYADGLFDDDEEITISVLEDYPPGSSCGDDGTTVLKFVKL